MQPAHKLTNGVVFLLIVGLSTMMASVDQLVLDLRKAPPSARRSMGVPGSAAGGILGKGEPTLTYELPVRVKIKELSLSDDALTVTLELSNTGTSHLRIPSCLDAQKAHAASALDCRSLQFGMIFKSSQTKTNISRLLDVTFGSASQPECSIPLEPGASSLVITEAHVSGEIRELAKEPGHVLVRAFVYELKLKDGEYYIERWSRRIESDPVEAPLRLLE